MNTTCKSATRNVLRARSTENGKAWWVPWISIFTDRVSMWACVYAGGFIFFLYCCCFWRKKKCFLLFSSELNWTEPKTIPKIDLRNTHSTGIKFSAHTKIHTHSRVYIHNENIDNDFGYIRVSIKEHKSQKLMCQFVNRSFHLICVCVLCMRTLSTSLEKFSLRTRLLEKFNAKRVNSVCSKQQ